MKAAVLGGIGLALFSCAAPDPVVIDGSSEEQFVASAAAARAQLPVADRLLFDKAVNAVGSRRHAARDVMALKRRTFGGRTAVEIVDEERARDRARQSMETQ